MDTQWANVNKHQEEPEKYETACIKTKPWQYSRVFFFRSPSFGRRIYMNDRQPLYMHSNFDYP